MLYLIDANNLAGELNILSEDNFDKKLIDLVQKFCQKRHRIVLVFDSNEFMGEKFVKDNLVIIYAPRDNYYHSADDKIIELAKKYFQDKKDFTLVSNDIELTERAKAINEFDNNILFLKAGEFALKLKDDSVSDANLPEDVQDDINNELLDLWVK